MRRRIILAAAIVSTLVFAIGARGDAAAIRQTALTYLPEATKIGNVFVQGTVLFEHDGAMAVGEPCSRVYTVDRDTGRQELVAVFACIPVEREMAGKFTIRTYRDDLGHCVLAEFQFPNDTEGHGVPTVLIE